MGAAIVATRFVLDQTSPAALAMLRYLVGFLVLLPLAVQVVPRPRFARRDLLPIAALGAAQFGVLILLLNIELQHIPAGRAALLFASLPLMTLLLAAVLGRERLTWHKTVSVLLTLLGVGLALGEGALAPAAGGAAWLGAFAVLASAACGAICSLFYRPYLERYAALPVSAFAMLASVLFLLPFAMAEGLIGGLAGIRPGGWAAIAFIGTSSGVGYFLWLWALRHTTPTKVTVFLALSPLTALLLGALLLGEPLSVEALLGLGAIVGGLWLLHRPGGGGA